MVWLISFGVTVYEVLRVEISKKKLAAVNDQTSNPYFQGFSSY